MSYNEHIYNVYMNVYMRMCVLVYYTTITIAIVYVIPYKSQTVGMFLYILFYNKYTYIISFNIIEYTYANIKVICLCVCD